MCEAVRFAWQPHWRFIALLAAMLPLTFAAGFWQLDRAEQKRDMIAAQAHAIRLPAIPLDSLAAPENYRRVWVEGRWTDALFLLDNRTRAGRVGYEVLGILRAANLPPVLVNRGWVAAGADRAALPTIQMPAGPQRIAGQLYRSPSKPLVLAPQTWADSWPERLQAIDFALLEARLGERLYPAVLRMEPTAPGAYQATWPLPRARPAMHTGYAVQWFAIGATLLVLAVFANSNLWEWAQHRRRNPK
ncbi:MAG: SURF1 family protein [Cellvibrionales bacterium]|nr:SURF1 family protein [Cellvibrionales bacterium]